MAVCEGGDHLSTQQSYANYQEDATCNTATLTICIQVLVPRLASLTPSPIAFRTAESAQRWC